MKRIAILVFLLAAVQHAQADDLKVPRNALWETECGACHVQFPPQLLTADNWKEMMDGLARHFGSNAELDAKERKAITRFLVENAGTQARHHSASLRITETPWFKREHRSISPKEWVHPDVKTPSNCKACHNVVGHTRWSERDLRKSGQRHGDDD
ncbi:MAG: diheme cytochrome c [Gammaproteobacteria bacterium]|nr:diheme cytochrome c [Gammaproteobacteria bacterium]MBU4045806.1 diheme cytochrome c [Gammaproteobacteria bacterium]MBU4150787.1 diheme cytochrome c [Gammaproteobacteria bacterium]